MKRSPLKRRTPLRANRSKLGLAVRGAVKRRKAGKPSSYASRERSFSYMGWVKSQPCILSLVMLQLGERNRAFRHRCSGPIEADHAGDRAYTRRAKDRTCIPLCKLGHAERHGANRGGVFDGLTKEQKREFRHTAIAMVHERAKLAGIEIPSC